MTTSQITFGMFSAEGNQIVADMVEFHKAQKHSWEIVVADLQGLADSDYELFGEAMDTEVREAVYVAMDFAG